MVDPRSRAQRIREAQMIRKAQEEARARNSSSGQMREDRQRPAYGSGYPMMGATSQAVQAPSIQAKPGLGQMARGMALNAAMNKGVETATPYVKEGMNTAKEKLVNIFPRTPEPMGSLPGSTAATANMENLVTPSRVEQVLAAEDIGSKAGMLQGATAAQPGFMSMLSGLGSQMGPMMMQYGMPLLGAYALSRMFSSGGYVGPLSKKG